MNCYCADKTGIEYLLEAASQVDNEEISHSNDIFHSKCFAAETFVRLRTFNRIKHLNN